MIQYNLKWNLLRCVTTDGGKNVCGAEKRLVGQIYKTCENIRCLKPTVIHSIIYQQVLCRNYLNVLYELHLLLWTLPS